MIERLFWGGVTLFLVVCVLGVQTLRHGFFTVQPHQGALVLDYKGRVLREANIGLNLRNPFLETVWTTEVTRWRTVRVEGLWSREACAVDGLVAWEIDNLVAYFGAQETLSVPRKISQVASSVARGVSNPFDLEADAVGEWTVSYRNALRTHPELLQVGVVVKEAYPVQAPCAAFGY